MVLESVPVPLLQWLAEALPMWCLVVGAVALSALFAGFVITSAFFGPDKAGDLIYRLLAGGAIDLVRISPRRVFALARLAVQESLRRRVLAGLAVFVAILAFAIWFLDAESSDPATLYLSFVLTATSYLVLLMALFLSAFSLPNDIKQHTIYTIVTKPVRPSEIVLGRILGFGFVGTCALAVMGLVSYVFVVRALNHTHELVERDLTRPTTGEGGGAPVVREGRTGLARSHRHQVTLDETGQGTTDVVQGHWHQVTATGEGAAARYELGPIQGQFHARVPVYGRLSFRDRAGAPKNEGINVGNEWTYRSYIEGGSLAAAIWKFEGIRARDFPEGLRLEMTIRVFRTHKGDIEKTVLGSFVLRNPRTGLTTRPTNFFAKEFATDTHQVELDLEDASGKPVKLFDDLVDDGNLEIELVCLQGGQYFGMARPDLYLLPREASFEANFVKGHVSIWLQMLLVIALGVMWSTFLNGAVAMLATLATLVGGFFVPAMQELASGQVIGGGTFESFFRIVTQKSISVELEEGLTSTVVKGLDQLGRLPMYVVSNLLPNFPQLSDTDYVAAGFNIPADVLLEQTLTTLGFLLPAFVIGFLCLKMREVAK